MTTDDYAPAPKRWDQRRQVIQGAVATWHVGGQGEPLVYLHGLDGVGPSWPLLERLADHWRVWAPSLPGFDDSERPEGVETVRDLTYWVLDWLEAVAVKRPLLVAESFGGWVALDLAVDYWRDLAGLGLMAPLGVRPEGLAIPDLFRLSPGQWADLACRSEEAALSRRAWLESDLSLHLKRREMVARVGWHPRLHDPKLLGRLRRIQRPTLVLWGAVDQFLSPSLAEHLRLALPQAKVAYVPEGGHAMAYERPEELEAVLGQWWGELGPRVGEGA